MSWFRLLTTGVDGVNKATTVAVGDLWVNHRVFVVMIENSLAKLRNVLDNDKTEYF